MKETAFKLIKFIIIIWCLCVILGSTLMASFSRSVAECILNRHYLLINTTNSSLNDNSNRNNTNANLTVSNVTYPPSNKRNEQRIVKTEEELKRVKFTYTVLVIVGSIGSGVIHATGLFGTVKERYCIILGYAVFMTFQTVIAFILSFKSKYEWIYAVFSVFISMLVYALASGLREKHIRIDSNQTMEHFGPKPEPPIVNVYGINRPPTPHPDHSQNTVSALNNPPFNPTFNNNLVPADNVLSYYQVMPPPVVLPPLSHVPAWRSNPNET